MRCCPCLQVRSLRDENALLRDQLHASQQKDRDMRRELERLKSLSTPIAEKAREVREDSRAEELRVMARENEALREDNEYLRRNRDDMERALNAARTEEMSRGSHESFWERACLQSSQLLSRVADEVETFQKRLCGTPFPYQDHDEFPW